MNYGNKMIIILCLNIYKLFSYGYLKLYKFKGFTIYNKRVVLYMLFRSLIKIVLKGGFDSVGDFDFKIPSPIAGELKIYKTEEQCNE